MTCIDRYRCWWVEVSRCYASLSRNLAKIFHLLGVSGLLFCALGKKKAITIDKILEWKQKSFVWTLEAFRRPHSFWNAKMIRLCFLVNVLCGLLFWIFVFFLIVTFLMQYKLEVGFFLGLSDIYIVVDLISIIGLGKNCSLCFIKKYIGDVLYNSNS